MHKEESDSDSEEEGQAFYAGGSETRYIIICNFVLDTVQY